jgi:hypothetical protein
MRAVVIPDPTLDTSFMAVGACRGKTRLFFPAAGAPGAEAKAVCDGCPVLRTCEAYATAAGVEGFWAGRWRKGSW